MLNAWATLFSCSKSVSLCKLKAYAFALTIHTTYDEYTRHMLNTLKVCYSYVYECCQFVTHINKRDHCRWSRFLSVIVVGVRRISEEKKCIINTYVIV